MSEINLRAERLNRGLSARKAAKQMRIKNHQVLLNAESGVTAPRPETAKKIADFYGCKVTDIWPVEEQVAA